MKKKPTKRRQAIATALGRLRYASYPPDFYGLLTEVVVGQAGNPKVMAELLAMLKATWPEQFREALSGTTLHARRRHQAWIVARFKFSGAKQEAWCEREKVDVKALQRALAKYQRDAAFRADVDSKIRVCALVL